MIFQTYIIWSNRIYSLKYLRFTTLGCEDKGLENQSLCHHDLKKNIYLFYRKNFINSWWIQLSEIHKLKVFSDSDWQVTNRDTGLLTMDDTDTTKKYIDQEPPCLMHQICVTSSHCSGTRSKQRIQGQRIIFEGKGPKGWNKNILLLTRKPIIIIIRSNLIY